MKISRVRLAGFKSFVDPCELRIMPGLTGLVGPNGCGKSNLLEAIRWVMGEGSPKSLRGAAMDDVIFAGTASRPQRQFAEVSILAERSNEAGDDEIEVVRRIERSAGSAYRINGRDVRARDAQLIFADAATGAHSPALVSQGRIGAIIAAKPSERRAMLEEAAGISGLHVRRREAEIRLKATETNLARAEEMIADQEARIAVLRRQARSAVRYRKLSDDIRIAEGRLIYARWRDAAAAAEAARADAAAADQAVHAAAETQRTASALAASAASALATARAAAQSARDAVMDVRHQLATVEAERGAITGRIADISTQNDQLVADRARESELARDASEALIRLAAEIEDLEISDKAAQSDCAVLNQAVIEADVRRRDADVALAQALAQVAREAADRRVAEAALAVAKRELARGVEALERTLSEQAAIADVGVVEAARDSAVQTRLSAQAEIDAALVAIAAAEAARSEATGARAAAEVEAASTAAALASFASEADALARDLDETTGVLSLVRAAPGYEVALAAVLADDLHAAIGEIGARRWAGAVIASGDPSLPTGEPLGSHVTAPKELARRLSQIAVVADDDGAALAVGQRLVTHEGKVRRWDGFASDGAGAAAAERLKRHNRLTAIEVELPDARSAADAATTARAAADAAVAQANQAHDAARNARDRAESKFRAALRDEDQANLAIERVTVRATELAARCLGDEQAVTAAKSAFDAAMTALAALPASADDVAMRELTDAAHQARDAAAQLRADRAARDGRVAADRARHGAALAERDHWRSRGGHAAKRVADMDRRLAALADERVTLADVPARLAENLLQLGLDVSDRSEAAQTTAEAERTAETILQDREAAAAMAGEILATAREARAGAQARTENQELRRIEMGRVASERFECPAAVLPEKLDFDAATLGAVSDESMRLERLAMERERIGPVNLVAENELAEIETGWQSNAADVAELTEAVHRLRGSIGSLNREGRTRLRAAFEAVDGHFRTLFGTLFDGGEAHLALIDSDDPLEAGLEIMAQPPGKKLSSLMLLSGGEQALTAVALIFALFLTNPAPLCVLDEVDAPLDDANVERFCDLLDAMTRDTDTRYLIVTHNAVTMARMHRLYGVTMIERGISRLVSVDLGGAEALLAAE